MPETPRLEEVFIQVLDDLSSRIRTIEPAEVTFWDRVNQFVNVQPLVRDTPGQSRGEIFRVPVIQPITYQDVQIGEIGLLLICDKNPSRWWRDGVESDPETSSFHSANNAIFIPGLRSLAAGRTILSDSTVLERPSVGGTVRLGIYNATKAAVHEDLLGDLSTFLTALDVWGGTTHANFAAMAAAFIGGVRPTITSMTAKIAAGNYQSPSVKVED